MRRRDFLGLAVGAAANWPTAVMAQGEMVRRVGILMTTAPSRHSTAWAQTACDIDSDPIKCCGEIGTMSCKQSRRAT